MDFSGCTTTVNGIPAPKCEPIDGAVRGFILVREGYAVLTLHKLEDGTKDGVSVITPKVGTLFFTFNMGKPVRSVKKLKCSGSFALKGVGGNKGLEEEKVGHTV